MKKKSVKLRLNRETLQALNTDEMPAVQGGASVGFCRVTEVCQPTQNVANCISQTCPSKCNQWYC